MKPQKFQLGQAVTPINNKEYKTVSGLDGGDDPRFGKIYHVSEYRERFGEWYIGISELSPFIFWNENRFAPIEMTSESLTALLEETKTVEA